MLVSFVLFLFYSNAYAEFTPASEATDCSRTLAENTLFVGARDAYESTIPGLHTARPEQRIDLNSDAGQAHGLPTPLCNEILNSPTLIQGCTGFVLRHRYLVTNYHCMIQGGRDQMTNDQFRKGERFMDVDRACRNLHFFDTHQPSEAAIPNTRAYSCNRVLTYSMMHGGQMNTLVGMLQRGERPSVMPDPYIYNRDFIIIELDRNFTSSGVTPSNNPVGRFEDVLVTGYPFGTGRMVSRGAGQLEPGQRTADPMNYNRDGLIGHTAETMYGNSGSPVARTNCSVVGIHHSKVPQTDDEPEPLRFNEQRGCFERNPNHVSRNYATPITEVVEALDRALNPPPTVAPAADETDVEQ